MNEQALLLAEQDVDLSMAGLPLDDTATERRMVDAIARLERIADRVAADRAAHVGLDDDVGRVLLAGSRLRLRLHASSVSLPRHRKAGLGVELRGVFGIAEAGIALELKTEVQIIGGEERDA